MVRPLVVRPLNPRSIMMRSAVVLLVITVAVSIHSVSSARDQPQILKDQYLAIGIDEKRRGRKLSSGKSGKGSNAASSMRLLLLANEFGRDNHYIHEHERPRMNIRRRGLDGSKSGKGGSKAKASKDGGSIRLLLSEFGM